MSVQNEVVGKGTNENHEDDIPKKEVDNYEIKEDGSFDLSFPTSDI